MNTTVHAERRVRKRVGVPKKAVDTLRDIAFDKGVAHSQATGRLRKYFDFLWSHNRTADNIRIYGNFVWVFCGDVLVTVHALPREHQKAARKILGGAK